MQSVISFWLWYGSVGQSSSHPFYLQACWVWAPRLPSCGFCLYFSTCTPWCCAWCAHPMLLIERTVLLCPAFLGLFWGLHESLDSALLLESAPFALSLLGDLSFISTLLYMFSRTNNMALELTGVEFSMRSYCCCHLTGHICNKCVARSAYLSVVTSVVAKFTFGLWNKFHKFLR